MENGRKLFLHLIIKRKKGISENQKIYDLILANHLLIGGFVVDLLNFSILYTSLM